MATELSSRTFDSYFSTCSFPLSLLIPALEYKPQKGRDFYLSCSLFYPETSIAPETHKALDKYLLSQSKSSLIHFTNAH